MSSRTNPVRLCSGVYQGRVNSGGAACRIPACRRRKLRGGTVYGTEAARGFYRPARPMHSPGRQLHAIPNTPVRAALGPSATELCGRSQRV